MSRKKALAFITAAVMLFGNAAVFPSIASSAAESTTVTLTKNDTISVNFTSTEDREFVYPGNTAYSVVTDEIKSAVAAQIDQAGTNDISIRDVKITYDYAYTSADGDTVDPADTYMQLLVNGVGGDADWNNVELKFGEQNENGDYNNSIPLSDNLTGTNKTVTFSALGGNAGNIKHIYMCDLGFGGCGKVGDSLTLTIQKIEYTVEYEKGYPQIVKNYDEYINAEAVKITYDLSKVGECGHENHTSADGGNYNPNNTYCPWASFYVHRVSASGEWSETGYEVYNGGVDKPMDTMTIMLKDIFAVIGTPTAGEQLVFAGNISAVPTSVEFINEFKPSDIDLNTGSVASGTIKEAEEWTPDGGKPLGKPDLNLGEIALIENSLETKLEGYKALQINYTVDNPSVLSAINVVLFGWEDNSVGWNGTYYAVSSSGTITIDLTPYQDKTYHNILVYPLAPATAKIGDSFAPGFTVTSAKLLTEYSGTFSETIPEVKPIENQPDTPSTPTTPPSGQPDNPSTPSNPPSGQPSNPSSPSTSSNSQNTSTSANTVTEKAVEEINNAAEGTTVKISLKNNTVADKNILIAIAGRDIDIEITVSDGVTIEINGNDVKNAKNVDLGVEMNSNAIKEERINEIAENKDTVQFSLKHNGDFGFKAKFNLPVNKKYNGKYANIYWDNKGNLEFVGSSKVTNGTVGYYTEHASDYVMVFDDYAYGDDVSSASGVYADSEDIESASYEIIAVFTLIFGVSAVMIKKFIVKSK